jgi:hypothetical protein
MFQGCSKDVPTIRQALFQWLFQGYFNAYSSAYSNAVSNRCNTIRVIVIPPERSRWSSRTSSGGVGNARKAGDAGH